MIVVIVNLLVFPAQLITVDLGGGTECLNGRVINDKILYLCKTSYAVGDVSAIASTHIDGTIALSS